MRWITCQAGAFPQRLYFDSISELDQECERLLERVYHSKFGKEFTPPLGDDDLLTLVEEHADIDLYAEVPRGVDGETEFCPKKRPLIKINQDLSSNEQRRNRMRTTIAHEWFHAVYHHRAWVARWALAARKGTEVRPGGCHEDTIVGAPEDNWTEFQAGYASCSILMPKRHVCLEVERTFGLDRATAITNVVSHVAQFYRVSNEAARWRLNHLGIVEHLKARSQLTLW